MQKRGNIVFRDAKTGKIQWRANAVISEKGSVTISARDALSSTEAQTQLDAVKRIREAAATLKR